MPLIFAAAEKIVPRQKPGSFNLGRVMEAVTRGAGDKVYLAHTQAVRLFPDRAEALRSQTPLVVLMIAYTMMSLWILAQPITNIRP